MWVLAGCSYKRVDQRVTTPEVTKALLNYEMVKGDKTISNLAPVELYKATKISYLLKKQEDKVLANHYAHLLNDQLKIASLTAEKDGLKKELTDVIVQRNKAIEAIHEQRAAEGDVTVSSTDFQSKYIISGDNFDNETIIFTKSLKEMLKSIANLLNKNLDRGVSINSYTDNIGSESHNMDISLKRAKMIRDKLVEYGVNEDRIKFIGNGGVNFIASNDTDEGRAQNNRIVLDIE
jgi:outer membrane protein OmpA-like peptidoglycan-associated protein